MRRCRRWRAIPPTAGRAVLMRHALARGRRGLQCGGAARRRQVSRRCATSMTCRITGCSTRSGCSTPVRRRGRSASTACGIGVPDLRGHLDRGGLRDAGRDRRRTAARSQWLALRDRTRTTSGSIWWSRGSPRPGCRSPISTRSAARTNSCSTALLRPQRRPVARLPDADVRGGPRHHRVARARTKAGGSSRRHRRSLPENEEETWLACVLGLKDYVEQEPAFPAWCSALSGGIDSAVVAAHGGRCPGRRPGPLRDAALSPTRAADSLDDAEACAKALGVSL